jgi:hypothetical protein
MENRKFKFKMNGNLMSETEEWNHLFKLYGKYWDITYEVIEEEVLESGREVLKYCEHNNPNVWGYTNKDMIQYVK